MCARNGCSIRALLLPDESHVGQRNARFVQFALLRGTKFGVFANGGCDRHNELPVGWPLRRKSLQNIRDIEAQKPFLGFVKIEVSDRS